MKRPIKHQDRTEIEPEPAPTDVPVDSPRNSRRNRGEPKFFISYLPEGKGGPREDKGSVPLEVEVEAHIEERTDCEPGLYRIEKKRSGEFSGDVMFYTKEPLTRARSVGPSEHFDADDTVLDESDAELPGDRLLRSLQGKTDGGRVIVIAKRKADPVGMAFRFPCATECTIGEVPYDEADPSIDALELAIQKLYGGGRYEIVVRQDGETLGSVVRTIVDPVEVRREREREDAPVRVVVPSPPVISASKSSLDELKASVTVFKEVASVLRHSREPEPERETPIETLKNAVSLVKDLNTYLPRENGVGEGDAGSTVRDWMDGIASIAREFGLGQMLNNVVAYGLHEAAARKRAAAATGESTGAGPPASPPAAASAHPPPPPAISAPPPLPDPVGTVAAPRAQGNVPLPGGLSFEMIPPPMRMALDKALSVVVAEMHRSESLDDHDTDGAVLALRELIESFPGAYVIVDYVMQMSSVRVLMTLSSYKPEWESILELKGAAGFIEVIQDDWSRRNEPEDSEALLSNTVEQHDGLQPDRAN